ncbi:MFS transporter [Altererythrobacter salegens]|uniref:MFS transporter n=1 Tax=Croceibacterium salegens TaxID=1737568 RepID=A0A6I4STK3_9SPHN|nr:MFS transporter [Croceibacterium salegens]MXO59344.1 MFS transporter [Croceibacterium salegens]
MNEAVAQQRFDVTAFIDERKLGWREFAMLAVCSLVLFIDGFDMYFFGKILPAIATGLNARPDQMDVVIFWTYVGMTVGAFLMPPLADRIGRRPVLGICAAGFGVLSIVGAYADTVTHMAIIRGLSGIFFSAMLPIGLALLSEMTPRRWRAAFMAIALVWFSGGNAASGVIAAWLLDLYGWQIGFYVGGVLGFLAIPLLLIIPESLAFRVTRNPADPKIPATINAIGANRPVQDGEVFHLGNAPPPERDLGPLALLQKKYLAQTLILWAVCFLSLGNIALLQNWLATFMQEIGGIPIQEFAISAMISFAGGAVGTLIMGFLMDRMNPYWLIAVFYFVEAIALYTLGSVPFSSGIFLGALIMWNFTQVGGQTGLNNLATLSYPPEMRSSGIGWAGGWGRISGMVMAPFAGAMALRMMLPLDAIMGLVAGIAVAVGLGVIVLGIVAPVLHPRKGASVSH